jgi:hypothetical protein
MKKILLLLLMSPLSVYADCGLYIIGFSGLNDAFDHRAFKEYSEKKNACYKTFRWQEKEQSISYIKKLNHNFELYGFSKGAETVSDLVKKDKLKPIYILTVGAYKTTDVDFTKQDIKFQNYFDYSGIGQKSPGIFVKNIPHLKMQQYINHFF